MPFHTIKDLISLGNSSLFFFFLGLCEIGYVRLVLSMKKSRASKNWIMTNLGDC